MFTLDRKTILAKFLAVPEFRARFLKEIDWALKGCCDHPLSNEELAQIWEDLEYFEEILDRALRLTPSKVLSPAF